MSPIVDSSQLERVDEILFEDLCPMIDYFDSLEECYSLTLNYGTQGIAIGLLRFLSMIEEDLRNYEYNKLVLAPEVNKASFFNSVTGFKACKSCN